jgi:chemotaxis protein CheZ
MAEKPLAFSRNSPQDPLEQEYEALHDAVAESTHGRWFLQEYARRHRAADTRLLLDAIQKLERFLSSDESGETPPRRHRGIRHRIDVIQR